MAGVDTDDIEEAEVLSGLAEAMAELSEGDVPREFEAPVAFSAHDVDWYSNGWLTNLDSVLGWLWLDGAPELADGAENYLSGVFELVGADPTESFRVEGGRVILTVDGVSALDSRMADAMRLKGVFQEDIDLGISSKEATRTWIEAWENEGTDAEDRQPQVHADVNKWNIKQFRDLAERNNIDLDPSYQRDFVWGDRDSRKLIDSILRGIPLPSIILNHRRIREGDAAGKKKGKIYEIVDGKQRLTTILRFIGQHSEGRRRAESRCKGSSKTMEDHDENHASWRRALKVNPKEAREQYLPFALERYKEGDPLYPLRSKYYSQVKDEEVLIGSQSVTIEDLFEGPTEAYTVPVIIYRDTDTRDIHEVFTRYNKLGKQLNAEEKRNARFHHLRLTRLFLVLSGDSDRASTIAGYVDGMEYPAIAQMLREMNVAPARFRRFKLVGWVCALLLRKPGADKAGALHTPSTGGFIDSLLNEIAEDDSHPLHTESRLRLLATYLITGAQLVQELRVGGESAFDDSFVGMKWGDLQVVGSWAAATIAAASGIELADVDDIADAVESVTKSLPPLKKQQSASQWAYLATVVPHLVTAMGADLSTARDQLEKAFGYFCMDTFEEVDRSKYAGFQGDGS